MHALEAVLVEVVPGGYNKVDAELLPDPSHLHKKKVDCKFLQSEAVGIMNEHGKGVTTKILLSKHVEIFGCNIVKWYENSHCK